MDSGFREDDEQKKIVIKEVLFSVYLFIFFSDTPIPQFFDFVCMFSLRNGNPPPNKHPQARTTETKSNKFKNKDENGRGCADDVDMKNDEVKKRSACRAKKEGWKNQILCVCIYINRIFIFYNAF